MSKRNPGAPRPNGTDAMTRSQLSLSVPTRIAAIVAFLVLAALLTVTTVTLISQRQKTVLLNRQIAALIDESRIALRGTAPLLNAVPRHSATIKARADSAARLVSAAAPLVRRLTTAGLPETVSAAGQLVSSLQQQGLVTSALANVSVLAASANRAGVVPLFGQLVGELPAASSLIEQLRTLASGVRSYRLISGAAGGLRNLSELVHLQTHALQVARAQLATGRSTRALTARTLATANRTLGTALKILGIAQQTLAHAASLDRKVGAVP